MRAPAVDAECVYRLFASTTVGALDDLIRSVGAAPSVSCRATLDALSRAFKGDIAGAIRKLRFAMASTCDAQERAYIADALCSQLVATCQFGHLEPLFTAIRANKVLLPACRALESVLEATRGNNVESLRCASLAFAELDRYDNVTRCRVLNRLAVAAYYRRDYAEAVNLGLQGAREAEASGITLLAAQCYSVPLTVCEDWTTDTAAALHYARRMRYLAEQVGHIPLQRHAVTEQFVVAATLGDRASYASARARLLETSAPKQYCETMPLAFAEAVGFGWDGNFLAARRTFDLVMENAVRSEAERSMRDSIIAVADLALGNLAGARALTAQILCRTSVADREEALYDKVNRYRARALAAMLCFYLGNMVAARRALSRRYDPGGKIMHSLTAAGVNLDTVPESMRGLGQYLNAALKQSRRGTGQIKITLAESEVLELLPHGMTLAAIADALDKSPKTVQRQVESIYSKLEATNRAQAIELAREAGFYR